MRGLLAKKCVVLVTHQLQYIQQCDAVLNLTEVLTLLNVLYYNIVCLREEDCLLM